MRYEWDERKNRLNKSKHLVSFEEALEAFEDPNHIVLHDFHHSEQEIRYFCIGRVKNGILTVRFIRRDNIIRIFGAGFWRKFRNMYLEKLKHI